MRFQKTVALLLVAALVALLVPSPALAAGHGKVLWESGKRFVKDVLWTVAVNLAAEALVSVGRTLKDMGKYLPDPNVLPNVHVSGP